VASHDLAELLCFTWHDDMTERDLDGSLETYRVALSHVVEEGAADTASRVIEDVDPESHRKKLNDGRLAQLAAEIGSPEASRAVAVTPESARSAIAEYARRTAPDPIVAGSRKSFGLDKGR